MALISHTSFFFSHELYLLRPILWLGQSVFSIFQTSKASSVDNYALISRRQVRTFPSPRPALNFGNLTLQRNPHVLPPRLVQMPCLSIRVSQNPHVDVVKTRMQLETGKSSLGLVGSLRAIVAQEGYTIAFLPRFVTANVTTSHRRFARLYRGRLKFPSISRRTQMLRRSCPAAAARST